MLQKALDALGDLPVTVFDQTPPNPTESSVRAAHEVWQASRCDGLIAVGGGSSIDLAKGLAIMATHPGPLTTYATIEGGSPKITPQAAPLIAVPTTAGTGSEVARGAIVIVDDGRKLGFHSWNLMPKAAILDPELTLGLPPILTAATGMDAIAHCMETFMAPAFNPPADGIALDGLERAWHHIERATRDGGDREARQRDAERVHRLLGEPQRRQRQLLYNQRRRRQQHRPHMIKLTERFPQHDEDRRADERHRAAAEPGHPGRGAGVSHAAAPWIRTARGYGACTGRTRRCRAPTVCARPAARP